MYYCYHCLLVPTDLTLTTDRLTELFQSVEDPDPLPLEDPYIFRSLRPKTMITECDIGGFLGLPESALAEIRKRYQSKAKSKEAYLDTYVHYHPCPSWKVIREILGKCSLRQQAEEVEVTYVQGRHALYRACTQCSYMYLKAGGGVLNMDCWGGARFSFSVQTVEAKNLCIFHLYA